MIRAAVLYDEKDRKLGIAMVPDTTFVVKHLDRFFFRQPVAVRLAGGGSGAKFIEMEPLVRDKLVPA